MIALALSVLFYSAEGVNPHFQLGACYGYFDSLSFIDYAVKLAFEQGFFDDILNTTAFSFNITSVDTLCSPTEAAKAGLPLFLGSGQVEGRIYADTSDVPPAIAINGCTCSGASKIVAAQAESFSLPMVSGSSTSPDLSNKDIYKFFARTIPPDSMQALGLAKLASNFNWARVFGIHLLGEAFGEGLINAFCDFARGLNIDCLIRTMPFLQLSLASLSNFESNWHRVIEGAAAIAAESPAPRILCMVNNQIDWLLYAFRLAGLTAKKHVWLLSEGSCSDSNLEHTKADLTQYQAASSHALWADAAPWNDVAESILGMGCLIPNPIGPRLSSSAFEHFWSNLTKASLVSAGYPMHASWDDSWLDRDQLVKPYWLLHFDGMTGLLVSIANMLARNVMPTDIQGEDLRKELFAARYEGLSGLISFNSFGDRLAPYDVMNLQNISGTSTLMKVGVYDGSADILTFSSQFVFGGGTAEVPADRPSACNKGYKYNAQADECQQCPVGKYEFLGECQLCQNGTFSNSVGVYERCVDCLQGYYQQEKGRTACGECPVGRFMDVRGALECKSCPRGNYADQFGMTECERCPLGTYANATGLSTCIDCAGALTTQHIGTDKADDCACAAGHYRDSQTSSTCHTCLEGMECSFGAESWNLAASLKLREGFWSSKEQPLVVYKCKPLSDCPGGLPETCKAGRFGLACGLCDVDFQFTDDGCEACKGNHVAGAILGGVLLLVMPPLLYPGVNAIHRWKLHPREALLITCEVIVELLQVCAAVTLMDIDWPEVSPDLFKVMAIFQIELGDIIPLPCIFPMSNNITKYIVTVMIIPSLVIVILLLYPFCSTVLFGGIFPKWDPSGTFNLCGKILNVLFISQVMLGMMPLQCYKHPEKDSSSIRQYTATLCGSSDHHIMLIFGLISLLGCSAGLVYLIWEMWRAPKKLADPMHRRNYMRRITFIVEDFKLSRYWWNIMAKMQELLLGLVILFDPNNTRNQLALFMMIFVISAVLWTRHWPYKLPFVNFMSIMTFSSLILLLLMGTNKLPFSNADEDNFADAVYAILLFVAFLVLIVGFTLVIGNLLQVGAEGELWSILHFDIVPTVEVLVGYWDSVTALTKEEMSAVVESWEHHERLTLRRLLVQLQLPGVSSTTASAFKRSDSQGLRVSQILEQRNSRLSGLTKDSEFGTSSANNVPDGVSDVEICGSAKVSSAAKLDYDNESESVDSQGETLV